MQIKVPYSESLIQLGTERDGTLAITFHSATAPSELFEQVIYHMSFDEIISALGEEQFTQLIAHYDSTEWASK